MESLPPPLPSQWTKKWVEFLSKFYVYTSKKIFYFHNCILLKFVEAGGSIEQQHQRQSKTSIRLQFPESKRKTIFVPTCAPA